MKTIIATLFLIATSSFAEEPSCSVSESASEVLEQKEITTDVPSHLKGATIIVRLADGRESVVPAERFKVVPRKQQFVVSKIATKSVRTCNLNEPNRNRVSLLGGRGTQEGIDVNKSQMPSLVTAQSKVGLVGGLQYQRLITKRLSLGLQGQTNKTGSIMIGIDF